MNMTQLMAVYGTSDKQKFPCAYPEWDEKRINTTFFADLLVGWKVGGINGINDTYNRCHSEWKDNAKYYTEFVGALNHLLWMSYEEGGDCAVSRLFDKLWQTANQYAVNNFKDEDLTFFTMVLD